MIKLSRAISLIALGVVLGLPLAAQAEEIRKMKFMHFHLTEGQVDELIEYLNNPTEDIRTPLEPLYGLAVAHAYKGDLDKAMSYVEKAVDAGIPVERFLAGPRESLAPLVESDAFREFLLSHPAEEVLHGPTVGSVTHKSARFWVRTTNEVSFKVVVGPTMDGSEFDPKLLVTGKTSAEEDYTGVAEVTGLDPDTEYAYQVFVDGRQLPMDPLPRFQTYPLPGEKAAFRVAFGGGSPLKADLESIWDTILNRDPLAFLALGDNNYYEKVRPLAVPRYHYYYRQSRPEWRRLAASTAVYAIWDDHDFGGNDSVGGPQIDVPEWKRPVWNVFRENWNNPYYGGGEEQPGVWHDFSIGDVDFFLLDCRYYRVDPQGENPTYTNPDATQLSMLGPVQKQWLLDKLKASTATFKVIASSVPWSDDTKTGFQTSRNLGPRRPGYQDTWQGFGEERDDIFSFIEENKIEGVFLISADRHRSDAWQIERPDGYDFFEAQSSHLTYHGGHPLMPGALFGWRGGAAFGLLSIDTTKDDPEIRYDIVRIDDKVMGTLSVRKSQLSFAGE